ncbi:hypothetical protein KIW84_065422 [Lathyrus oleraceus]|uniref:Uncharacterized protein n=1 Tax=Pisum sativum TaxID=3888 RepID=A0A9D4WCY1_PEA|nr:hypothetical protein KIW84_065422 [Pisum sativum]
MGSFKVLRMFGILMLLFSPPLVFAYIECTTVAQLFSSCSIFIRYGTPDPIPGSPCCDAMSGLSIISNSGIYGMLESVHVPGTRWATYNYKSRLKHSKCSLHIFSSRFLMLSK